MAKYYSSTFGKISGKHGTAVAVIMKDGSTYLREYKKPSNPRTDKQQAHRAKFALSSRALVPFNPIFKATMGITNGISTARSYAFKNAIVGEYPNFYMEYEKLMFSFGTIDTLHSLSAAINEGVITLDWDFNKKYNCHGNDSVSLVVFNKNTNQAIHIDDIALRSNKTAKIDIRDAWTDAELYLWAYLKNGDKFSDSVFVGKFAENNDKCEPSGIDLCVRSESEVVDNKQDGLSVSLAVNKIIMALVMMLYNLFGLFHSERLTLSHTSTHMLCNLPGLFNQKAHIYIIQNQINALSYSLFVALRHMRDTYKEVILSLHLKNTRRAEFEVLRV